MLVDGDTLVYTAALSAEKPVEWENDLWTLHAHLNESIEHFDRIVGEITERLKPDHVIMALSDPNSTGRWRNDVMPSYKMGRKKTRRPIVYAPLRAYVHEAYETFEREGLEGDDILGILATKKEGARERIIVSIDKDLKTIPGKLFNYGKPDLDILEVSEDQANYNHLYQTLTGDTTDGYPGCPGVGPVSAKKLLDPFWVTADGETWFDEDRAWAAVVKAYRKAKLDEEAALMNARVARILRAEDFNFKRKEVILWTP